MQKYQCGLCEIKIIIQYFKKWLEVMEKQHSQYFWEKHSNENFIFLSVISSRFTKISK